MSGAFDCLIRRTPEEGADTLLWLALDDGAPLRETGLFWLELLRPVGAKVLRVRVEARNFVLGASRPTYGRGPRRRGAGELPSDVAEVLAVDAVLPHLGRRPDLGFVVQLERQNPEP